MDRVEVHNGQAYLMPEAIPETSGISFLRRGLYLGELKKGRFEPAQELAMALDAHGEDPPGRRISFSSEDDRVSRYLKGETISGFADPEDSGMNGWRLVTVDGLPLGWAKLVGGQLKNKYLLSWRDQ
jgi:NOL1/NOP2/fmu family ribosome biogenesis protein